MRRVTSAVLAFAVLIGVSACSSRTVGVDQSPPIPDASARTTHPSPLPAWQSEWNHYCSHSPANDGRLFQLRVRDPGGNPVDNVAFHAEFVGSDGTSDAPGYTTGALVSSSRVDPDVNLSSSFPLDSHDHGVSDPIPVDPEVAEGYHTNIVFDSVPGEFLNPGPIPVAAATAWSCQWDISRFESGNPQVQWSAFGSVIPNMLVLELTLVPVTRVATSSAEAVS